MTQSRARSFCLFLLYSHIHTPLSYIYVCVCTHARTHPHAYNSYIVLRKHVHTHTFLFSVLLSLFTHTYSLSLTHKHTSARRHKHILIIWFFALWTAWHVARRLMVLSVTYSISLESVSCFVSIWEKSHLHNYYSAFDIKRLSSLSCRSLHNALTWCRSSLHYVEFGFCWSVAMVIPPKNQSRIS